MTDLTAAPAPSWMPPREAERPEGFECIAYIPVRWERSFVNPSTCEWAAASNGLSIAGMAVGWAPSLPDLHALPAEAIFDVTPAEALEPTLREPPVDQREVECSAPHAEETFVNCRRLPVDAPSLRQIEFRISVTGHDGCEIVLSHWPEGYALERHGEIVWRERVEPKRRRQQMYIKGFRQARDLAIQVLETVNTTDRSLLANALRAIHPPTKIRQKSEVKP